MTTAAPALAAAELKELPISKLVPCPSNPRKRRNDQADAELLASIEARGVLSPIIARQQDPAVSTYEIGAGHRRWECAKKAGLKTVFVMVRPFTDEEFYDLVMIDNLQHDSLHPLDEAEGYAELMRTKQLDIPGLAVLVNKKESDVQQSIKLLDLANPVKQVFEAGRMDVKAARMLARLQPADQLETLKECGPERDDTVKSISTTEVRRFIERALQLDLSKAPFDTTAVDLVAAAGACVTCPKRSGANVQLFPDVKDKDRCFDRACFNVKVKAHLATIEAKLKKDGETFKGLSMGYESKDKSLLNNRQWREAKGEPCKNTITGIVKELQYGEGKLGKVMKVCTDGNCRVHNGRSDYERPTITPAARLKTRLENLTVKRDQQIREFTLAAVQLAVAKEGPSIEDLKMAVSSYFDRYWHDMKREYFKRKMIEPLKSTHGGKDFVKTFQEHLLKPCTTAKEVQALLLDMALQFHLVINPYQKKETDELMAAAERHGVNVKAIRAQVMEEYAAKTAKIKKAVDAKTTTKKPAKKAAAKKKAAKGKK